MLLLVQVGSGDGSLFTEATSSHWNARVVDNDAGFPLSSSLYRAQEAQGESLRF